MIKIERSFPAPESLAIEAQKASGSCRLPDVTRRLRADFFDKCYICGIKPVTDPEIEHRLPHKNNTIPGRKFCWNNLFWACTHCNSVKNVQKYDAGIIDCCVTDPETCIRVEVNDKKVSAFAVDAGSVEAALTAELIQEVFNKSNTGIREAACENRFKALQAEMNTLYTALDAFATTPASRFNRRRLHILLARSSPFAEFKRDYVRAHLSDYPALAPELL